MSLYFNNIVIRICMQHNKNKSESDNKTGYMVSAHEVTDMGDVEWFDIIPVKIIMKFLINLFIVIFINNS